MGHKQAEKRSGRDFRARRAGRAFSGVVSFNLRPAGREGASQERGQSIPSLKNLKGDQLGIL